VPDVSVMFLAERGFFERRERGTPKGGLGDFWGPEGCGREVGWEGLFWENQ
jgi:hypothetical protein